jgi:hypothetical protein
MQNTKITVKRLWIDEGVTLSKIYVDDKYICLGLEDPLRVTKLHGQTGIPAGVYNVALRFSPKFSPKYGHEMLWIQNVPGFEFILIHPGNTKEDTDGCLLVGSTLGVIKDRIAVLASTTAYNTLYKLVLSAAKAGKLQIEYINY